MDTFDLGVIKGMIKNTVPTKMYTYTFTATSTTSTITHNLDYVPSKDILNVYYNGIKLNITRGEYSEPNSSSIALTEWSIQSGETIDFELYKNVRI